MSRRSACHWLVGCAAAYRCAAAGVMTNGQLAFGRGNASNTEVDSVGTLPAITSDQDRAALIRQGFWLEWLSIVWMSIEAIVAVTAGVMAGSLTLIAFGLDSIIEMLSAGVLIWRLTVELRRGQEFSERTEQLAGRLAGGLLFVLAAY